MPALVSVLIPGLQRRGFVARDRDVGSGAKLATRVEVIVVDDGSTDRTLAAAQALESGSVKVITQPNSGAPIARNTALFLRTGDYIQWLDADDLLHVDKIAAQMRVAGEISDPLMLPGAFGTFYYREEKAAFTPTSLWRDLSPLDYFLIRFNENTYFQTDAAREPRVERAQGPWTDLHSPDDDGEYFCRVVMNSVGIRFVADARSELSHRQLRWRQSAKVAASLSALFESKVKCIATLADGGQPRTRAAAAWLPDRPPSYPGRMDLVERANHLANNLGGNLSPPRLKWKYRPVEWLFGYDAAIRASSFVPESRQERQGNGTRSDRGHQPT